MSEARLVGVCKDRGMPRRPLSGIQVVDLTVGRGEMCSRLLSDLGARVIKVEQTGGSPSRALPPIDDGHSLYWTFRNAGKLGVELDLESDDGREKLHELLAHSDVVIDSAEPGTRDGTGLDVDDMHARHPHLIAASITAYGRFGPYAGRDVPDAVIEATGGMTFKAGAADRAPILPPGRIGDDTASMTTAFGILCALWQREGNGAGQVIDASANECLAQITDWSISNWTRSADAGMPSSMKRNGPGFVYTIIPCKDGFVRLVVMTARQWHAIRAWLGEPDYLQDPELDGFMGRLGIADSVLNPLYAELFADMTMEEVSIEAQNRGIVCTPFLKPNDVLVNEHFMSRATFDDVPMPDGRTMKLPSGFFEIDGERVGPVGRPPQLGEHTDEVFANLGEARPAPAAPLAKAPPLADMKVMDFGHGGVGVEVGRMFADHGADVVKIESRTYFDFIRTVLGGEMSPSFSSSSRTKRSLGVNTRSDKGRELLYKMVADTHVVIENNSTGTMDTLQLGYVTMAQHNPNVVMMSSQLMGSRGAWAEWIGYGPNTQVTGALAHLWNYENQHEPAGNQAIFPDHFAGRTGAVGALAAALGRRRTDGPGAHVEVCQVEQVVHVMGDILAWESLVPGAAQPRGNHSDIGSPWGLYRCSGDDQWVAICCRTDEEWQALAGVLGSPEWSAAADLATVEGRRTREDEVDYAIAEWTASLTREAVTDACIAAGVPAGPMLDCTDQASDPHLEARRFLKPIFQPPIGNLTLEGPGFLATAMDEPADTPAPGLGQHTREVATGWLGLSEDETEALIAEGVLEIDLVAEASD